MSDSHATYDIREVSPSSLVEPDRNPNHMPAAVYEQLVTDIREIGFLQPVLAEEIGDVLRIVDGCHRVRAAKEAGVKTIPVIVANFTDNPKLAQVIQIAMNRLRGELNLAEVAQTLADLAAEGWTRDEMRLTGFTESELTDLLATSARTDEDVMENAKGQSEEPAGDAEGAAKPYALELLFATKAELMKAKRGLKKAAGVGNELSVGLLALLDGA